MADFCKSCEPTFDDMKGLTSKESWEKGFATLVLCEGCGPIQVDPEGYCVSEDCLCQGQPNHGKPWINYTD